LLWATFLSFPLPFIATLTDGSPQKLVASPGACTALRTADAAITDADGQAVMIS
jgi:hypothetical protein